MRGNSQDHPFGPGNLSDAGIGTYLALGRAKQQRNPIREELDISRIVRQGYYTKESSCPHVPSMPQRSWKSSATFRSSVCTGQTPPDRRIPERVRATGVDSQHHRIRTTFSVVR
jgi:hypothetical protein